MTETLLHHQHPPTPPETQSQLHNGLHQIAEYVAERNQSNGEDQQQSFAYGSPTPGLTEGTPQSLHSFHASPRDGPSQLDHLGDQYGDYTHSSAYAPGSHLHGMPNLMADSPPTPRSSFGMDENDRRTRSGRTIAPATPPPQTNKPRAKSASRSKKAKTGKADKPKTPKLTMPLSILTKDMASVPVRDMREWVNRSAEERRKEVEKRNGYVTRPMNSFMLYRSAYAERTKQWCLQNNHQVVSSVSGESWPMEPPEVRELYNEYAKIERMNHQNAHPNYKFSPSKTAAPAKKRKEEFSEEEPSDFEDAEWGPGIRRVSHRSRRARPIGNEHLSISMAGPSYDIFGRPFTANGDGPDRAAWDMNHVGRPMALPMQGDLYNQYFQPDMHPGMGMDPTMVEELQRQASFSGLHFSPGQAMLGLPGGNVADMMQHLHSGMGTPLGDEGQVDPMLLAFDGAHHADMTSAMLSHSGFRDGHLDLLNQDLGHDKQSMPDGYTSEQWHSDPSMPVMEQGSEFEKWMDDH